MPAHHSRNAGGEARTSRLQLLDLSSEIIEIILLHLEDVQTFALIAQTCSRLRAIVNQPSDSHLWRCAFLQRYDDPRPNLSLQGRGDEGYDWRLTLQQREHARRISVPNRVEEHETARAALLEIRLSMLDDGIVGPELAKNFRAAHDSHWQQWNLCGGRFVSRTQEGLPVFATMCQASAKLSTITGTGRRTRLNIWGERDCESPLVARAAVRHDAFCCVRASGGPVDRSEPEQVYDLSRWTRANHWGPFLDDGEVDWNRMNAIMLVACDNTIDVMSGSIGHAMSHVPCRMSYARPFSAPGWDDTSIDGDWAGVTGHWRRTVCFLDWTNLQAFQTIASDGGSYAFFNKELSRGYVGEAVRILKIEARVTGFKKGCIPNRPTILFEAISQGGTPHESTLVGRVEMRKSRQIVWRFVSHYGGQKRWSSIGAQVGGERSAFGVLGIWSGLDHDFENGDPAGPFWLWKVTADAPDPPQPQDDVETGSDFGSEDDDGMSSEDPFQEFLRARAESEAAFREPLPAGNEGEEPFQEPLRIRAQSEEPLRIRAQSEEPFR